MLTVGWNFVWGRQPEHPRWNTCTLVVVPLNTGPSSKVKQPEIQSQAEHMDTLKTSLIYPLNTSFKFLPHENYSHLYLISPTSLNYCGVRLRLEFKNLLSNQE